MSATNLSMKGVDLKSTSVDGNLHISGIKQTVIKQSVDLNSGPPSPGGRKKLPSSWNVPLQNTKFTGRQQKLNEISDFLERQDVSIVACVGPVGMGKTDLVVEYVHRHLKKYQGGVAWFAGDEDNTLEKQCIKLGRKLDVSQASLKKDPKHELKTWLEDEQRSNWLLVFDDVENLDEISDMVPNKGGKIIVTSCYQSWDHVIRVDEFKRSESVDYLKRVCPMRGEDNEWNKLAHILGDLPSALNQASDYLNENQSYPIKKVLDYFKKPKETLFVCQDIEKMFKMPLYLLKYQKALKNIEEQSHLAFKLLHCLSFLAPDNIPHSLFEDFLEIFSTNEHEPENIELLFGRLHRYSLVTYNNERNTWSINRLFQGAVCMKVIKEKDFSLMIKTLLLMRFWFRKRSLSLKNDKELRQLVPHFISLHKCSEHIRCQVTGDAKHLNRISNESDILFFNISQINFQSRSYDEDSDVKQYSSDGLKHMKKNSIPKIADAASEKELDVKYSNYQYEIFRLVCKIDKRVFDDLTILESTIKEIGIIEEISNDMADTITILSIECSKLKSKLECQRFLESLVKTQREKSIKYNIIVLQTIKFHHHNDQQKILNNFLDVFTKSETLASPLQQCCAYTILIELLETTKHLSHFKNSILRHLKKQPITVVHEYDRNFNLGVLKRELGFFHEAREHFKNILTFPVDDFNNIRVKCSLAAVNYHIQYYDKAETYFSDAKTLINSGSLLIKDLLEALEALGDAYFFSDQIFKAKEAYAQALKYGESLYESRHFKILKLCLYMHMISYVKDCEESTLSEIEKLFQTDTTTNDESYFKSKSLSALKYSANAFKIGHEKVAFQYLKSFFILSFLFGCSKRTNVHLSKEALRIIFKNAGASENSTANNFIEQLQCDFYSVSLNVSDTLLLFELMENPNGNLPQIIGDAVDENQFQLSCIWSDAVSITINDESIDFICSLLYVIQVKPLAEYNRCLFLEKKGEYLHGLNEYDSACDTFNEAIDICKNWKGIYEMTIAKLNLHWGLIHLDHKQYAEAEAKFKNALGKYEACFGPDHKYVAMILVHLGITKFRSNCWGEAEQYFKDSLNIELELYGEEHPKDTGILKDNAKDLFKIIGENMRGRKKVIDFLLTAYKMSLSLLNFEKELNMRIMHPVTMALSHKLNFKFKKGKLFLEKLLRSEEEEEIGEKSDIERASAYVFIAELAYNIQNYKISRVCLDAALNIYYTLYKEEDHKDILDTHFKLGATFMRLNKFSAAYSSFAKSLYPEKRKSIFWSLLKLGDSFWQLGHRNWLSSVTFHRNNDVILKMWYLIENREHFEHYSCCCDVLTPFWETLKENVNKYVKSNKSKVLEDLEDCRTLQCPFNSERIGSLLVQVLKYLEG